MCERNHDQRINGEGKFSTKSLSVGSYPLNQNMAFAYLLPERQYIAIKSMQEIDSLAINLYHGQTMNNNEGDN